MDWKKLFDLRILERGYDYYCENAVEDMEVTEDSISASVMGTEEYEVEILLFDDEITDMHCCCPYAEEGRNCKHMAAVLYEWSSSEQEEVVQVNGKTDLFGSTHTMNAYQKKRDSVSKLVEAAERETLTLFLTDILMDSEKLLARFYNIINKQVTEEDVERYKNQVDAIANHYLGRNQFISYYEADNFMSELEDMIDEDVRRMTDNGDYLCAFELMNYIFALVGDVDMDDSDGGTSMLADRIYQLWVELLSKVNSQEKRKMFDWFTSHLDGSIIDYLENT